VFAALAALLGAEPPGMYLPPSETGGTEFQFNPASPDLRQAAKRPEPRPDDLLDARALAEDLVFLRRALRKLYVGYPELLQLPDFDVEALFDRHIARLRGGPAKVKFGESAVALFGELKKHIDDSHFYLEGAGDPRGKYTEYQATIAGPLPTLSACMAGQASPKTLRIASVLGADGRRGQLLTVSARPQGENLELTCGQQRFALKARPATTREDAIFKKPVYEWRRVGDAAIIRIRNFQGPPASLALLEKFVADYPQHRRSALIVFDLRGNGGGDDSYASRWVKQAKRGVWDSGGWSLHPTGAFLPWYSGTRRSGHPSSKTASTILPRSPGVPVFASSGPAAPRSFQSSSSPPAPRAMPSRPTKAGSSPSSIANADRRARAPPASCMTAWAPRAWGSVPPAFRNTATCAPSCCRGRSSRCTSRPSATTSPPRWRG
jgi:hypothetical protein